MFLIIGIAMFIGGYSMVHGKGAPWYFGLMAGAVPAGLCLFFGVFGLAISACLLGSYAKIQWPA